MLGNLSSIRHFVDQLRRSLDLITSTICFALAGSVFKLRKGSLLFDRNDRAAQKNKLLSNLRALRREPILGLAKQASRLADDFLCKVSGGYPLGSAGYFLRLCTSGILVGLAFCVLELSFFSQSIAHCLALVRSSGWQQNLFLPTVSVAAVNFPIDAFIAHSLIRWSMRGTAWRSVCCMVLSAAIAYALLAVGAGIAFGTFLMVHGALMPSFVLNRAEVAFLHPWLSSGQISQGGRWISYSGVSAAGAFMGILSSLLFFGATVLKAFPERIRLIVASPMFLLLGLLGWFDRSGLNFPLRTIAYAGAIILVIFGVALLVLGL